MRILFVGGMGRSGTTLLERLLGELPGTCAIGESAQMWQMGVSVNEPCGCGKAFHDCEFWQKVGELAFGGWSKLDIERVLALRASIDRTRFLSGLALPRQPSWLAARAAEYADLYVRLYSAVGEVSGAQTIVDGSKLPALAFALRDRPELDLRVIHVIRDSRGVAYSWTKRVARTGATGGAAYLPTYSPMKVAVKWNIRNIAFGLLGRLGAASQRLRYEDLIQDPRAALHRIARFANIYLDDSALSFISGNRAWLPARHGIHGNPMRSQSGDISLRPDDAWRYKFPTSDRTAVSIITAPLLLRYGYRVSAQSAEPEPGGDETNVTSRSTIDTIRNTPGRTHSPGMEG